MDSTDTTTSGKLFHIGNCGFKRLWRY